jgi:hypothetical protein
VYSSNHASALKKCPYIINHPPNLERERERERRFCEHLDTSNPEVHSQCFALPKSKQQERSMIQKDNAIYGWYLTAGCLFHNMQTRIHHASATSSF